MDIFKKKDPSLSCIKVYNYSGVTASGQLKKGQIRGLSPHKATLTLKEQGLVVQDIKQRPTLLLNKAEQKPIKSEDINHFFRQLATMINAGIPLSQALEFVANGTDSLKMASLVQSLYHQVSSGTQLAVALEKYPQYFDPLVCNLVAIGEESGTLDALLIRIANYLERIASLKARVKKALYYPIIIILVMLSLAALLLTFVVPRFQGMFQSFGKDLPAPTQAVIDLSQFLQNNGFFIILFFIALVAIHQLLNNKSEKYKDLIAKAAIKMPLFSDLITKAITARILRTLAVTLHAGVPIANALNSTAKVANNRVYSRGMEVIKDRIVSGEKMGDVMRESQLFSTLVIQMITVGEQAGALEEMLQKVAEYYEEQVDRSVDTMSALIEPLMIVMLGIIIGGFVVSMYLPIFKIGTLV